VLAPSDTGLTTQEKPTIYWFASQPVDKPVELTITSTESLQDAAKPVLEITLQPPLAKGIHAFRLADHGVALKPASSTSGSSPWCATPRSARTTSSPAARSSG
jgi:hypothetical protein